MSDNDDKYELSLENRLIWHAYVEQEQIEHKTELDTRSFEELLEAESDEPIKKAPISEEKRYANSKKSVKTYQSNEVDKRTDEKLRKGKMRIDARCDLHGLNQTQAHEILEKFILTAVSRHCRCVLIITGKGKSKIATGAIIEPERGILKEKVPQWLAQRSLSLHILKTYPAQPKDGGSGALYVYLRRYRS